jgi:hypothetical protein
MQRTLLVEADLDEATVGGGLHDAVTAGAAMNTVLFSLSAFQRSAQDADGSSATREAAEQAILNTHRQNAPKPLRMRGAAGFALNRSDLAFVGDGCASYKDERLSQAQGRVLSDNDLRDLLDWSAMTGNPLNLRGCNLSDANLSNAMLDGACLAFVNLTGADIRGASFVGADIENSYGWPELRGTQDKWWKFWKR